MASHGDQFTKKDKSALRNNPVDYPPPCDLCAKDGKCKDICASYKTWEKTGV